MILLRLSNSGYPSENCGNVVSMPKYSVSDRLYECVLYYCGYTSAVSRPHIHVSSIGCITMLYIIVGTRAWYHRSCLEEMAYSAGVHFFKCPLCNNIEEWQEEMLQCGIFIPDR